MSGTVSVPSSWVRAVPPAQSASAALSSATGEAKSTTVSIARTIRMCTGEPSRF
ncbi:MAG: hypothetical protein H0W76_11540 [Pyrinomonadaceae bacterium]|nr:hypothetical protein [Pyrinomonadaceae bacterium]